jgi:hypothetical protein
MEALLTAIFIFGAYAFAEVRYENNGGKVDTIVGMSLLCAILGIAFLVL